MASPIFEAAGIQPWQKRPMGNSFGDAAAAANNPGTSVVQPAATPIASPPHSMPTSPSQTGQASRLGPLVSAIAANPGASIGGANNSNPTDARLAAGIQASPGAPSPSPAPGRSIMSAISGDVAREGNSYSGMNVAGDISVNGQSPGGSASSLASSPSPAPGRSLLASAGIPGYGSASPITMPASAMMGPSIMDTAFGSERQGAAQTLSSGSQVDSIGRLMASGQIRQPEPGFSGVIGQQSGNGNMWSRTPEQQRRDAEVQASSIHKPTAGIGVNALRAMDAQDLEGMRGANALQREIMQLRGANYRAEGQQAGENARAILGDAGNFQRTTMEQGGALQRTAMQEAGHLERQKIAGQATVDAANARSQAPAGYRYTSDGRLTHIPGGPADPTVLSSRAPLNDTQSKALQFGTRMQEAGKNLDKLAADGVNQPGFIKRMAGDGAFGSALNWTQSGEQQQVEQSQRDYINAVLRRESGAAIADAEFSNARKQYFPQVGDEPEVIKQKRGNREIATAGIMAEVPDAERRVGQVLGAVQKTAPPGQGQPTPGANAERGISRSGTMNGRRVIQYSDGSVEYAN